MAPGTAPAEPPAEHDPTGGPRMAALILVLAYVLVAFVYAFAVKRYFGTNDLVAVVWLSALWPLSLAVLAVLLPLERTRFAASGWRRPAEDMPRLLEGPSERDATVPGTSSDVGSDEPVLRVEEDEDAGSDPPRPTKPVGTQPSVERVRRP